MRIGFDLDGVLADLHTPFEETIRRLFPEQEGVRASAQPDAAAAAAAQEGRPAAEAAAAAEMALTRPQLDAIWKHLGGIENFWESLAELEPGAIARLASLSDERRWEVIFLTSRPKSIGYTVQRQSQRWLQQCGFPMPSLFVVQGSRGRIADALALDVVIDDRPDNCLDVVLESRAGAILLWRGGKEGVPASAKRMGIAALPSVQAALDALVEADASNQDGNLLDRLRRILGIRIKPKAPFIR